MKRVSQLIVNTELPALAGSTAVRSAHARSGNMGGESATEQNADEEVRSDLPSPLTLPRSGADNLARHQHRFSVGSNHSPTDQRRFSLGSNNWPADQRRSSFPTPGTFSPKRTYSTDNNKPTTAEELLLEHHPISMEERAMLEQSIGKETFDALDNFRHDEGLCHSDTIRKFIELAGNRSSSALVWAKGNFPSSQLVGSMLNASAPFVETFKGNLKIYTIDTLLDKGVPDDCVGVVISAMAGAIDPKSEQATSATKQLNTIGEPGGFNHSFGVLAVKDGQVYCFDGDPYRGDASPFFKTDVATFKNTIVPRALGSLAVPKAPENSGDSGSVGSVD